MAEHETLDLLEAIGEHRDLHTAVILTYGADLVFFEEVILRLLWQNGCRHVIILMDAARYAQTLENAQHSLTWVGRRYVIMPVHMGTFQAFHAKMILLLGPDRGTLLIGSGNLTFTGYGHNHEIFSRLTWTTQAPEALPVFSQAWQFLDDLVERWCKSDVVRDKLRLASHVADWISSEQGMANDVGLVHNVHEPLIAQCERLFAAESVNRITVVTPFLDNSAQALAELHRRFNPTDIRLVLQHERAMGSADSLRALQSQGVPLLVHRFADDLRYLHAKIYLFDTDQGSTALVGSANCTRPAWLASSSQGNVEIMLWCRGESASRFAYLTEGHIRHEPITSWDEIELRSEITEFEGHRRLVELLDATVISRDKIGLRFNVHDLPAEVVELCFTLESQPPYLLPLGTRSPGEVEGRFEWHGEGLTDRPVSASIQGLSEAGEPLDLGCNRVWLNHLPTLEAAAKWWSSEVSRSGGFLASGVLESEDEWKDLYDALARLMEWEMIELARNQRRYETRRDRKMPRSSQTDGASETEIMLVDEEDLSIQEEERLEADIARESPFYALFEYVRGHLPGAPRDSEQNPAPDPSGNPHRSRRKWTPSEHMGRRFSNLVTKYVRSLDNVSYMEAAPIPHVLAYYAMFQRIAWLLQTHGVVDADRSVELITQINAGFFGTANDCAPAIAPTRSRHLDSRGREEWLAHDTQGYALGSLLATRRLIPHMRDDVLKAQAHEQMPYTVAAVMSVTGTAAYETDDEAIEVVAALYEQDSSTFRAEAAQIREGNALAVAAILDQWIRDVNIALGHSTDALATRRLRSSRVAYAEGRYAAISLGDDIDACISACSSLISWLRGLGEADLIVRYSEELVRLYSLKGDIADVARALCEKGEMLFADRSYPEATDALEQALVLAESLSDDALASRCKTYLRYCGFFLQS